MHIDWDLLAEYLAGTCTDEKRTRFERWLAEAPEHRAMLRGAQRMITDARREVPTERTAEVLASLRHAIWTAERSPALRVVEGSGRSVVVFPSSSRWSRWAGQLKIAAVVLLVVGAAGVWMTLPRGESVQEAAGASFREIVTSRGQRVALQFGDGSTVVLAPESRLRIPRHYGVHERTVFLKGEGAFTVTHDVARPFAVHTAHGVARDLGTRFVVREYEDDSSVEVVVADGEVELRGRIRGDTPKVRLTRGQLGRVEVNGDVAVRSGVDLESYMAWTEGRLVFLDTPLREAARRIARWYDVDVRFDTAAIGQRTITAVAQDEPVGDVLQMVAASLSLDLQTSASGRVYTLRAR